MLGRATGAGLPGGGARPCRGGGGLAREVREAIARIRAAPPHPASHLPQHRAIFNLAPAEVRKHGTGLDLPMAIALLAADGQIRRNTDLDTVLAGELALDGSLRPVRGALPIALAARESGRKRVIVPKENADEAALAEGIEVIPASTLAGVAAAIHGIRGMAH